MSTTKKVPVKYCGKMFWIENGMFYEDVGLYFYRLVLNNIFLAAVF